MRTKTKNQFCLLGVCQICPFQTEEQSQKSKRLRKSKKSRQQELSICEWCGAFFVKKKNQKYCPECLSIPKQDKNLTESKFCVYILKKSDGIPFYVGKGIIRQNKCSRIYDHLREAMSTDKNAHRLNIIRSILNHGEQLDYEIDSEFDLEIDAYRREEELIKSIGTIKDGAGPLVNIKRGGVPSEAEIGRIQMSLSQRKRKLNNVDRKRIGLKKIYTQKNEKVIKYDLSTFTGQFCRFLFHRIPFEFSLLETVEFPPIELERPFLHWVNTPMPKAASPQWCNLQYKRFLVILHKIIRYYIVDKGVESDQALMWSDIFLIFVAEWSDVKKNIPGFPYSSPEVAYFSKHPQEATLRKEAISDFFELIKWLQQFFNLISDEAKEGEYLGWLFCAIARAKAA